MGKVIGCKIEANNLLTGYAKMPDQIIKRGQVIPVKEGTNFNFFLDASCFDDKKVSEAKWAFIYERYYSSIKDDKEKQNDLWADIGNGQNQFIAAKGIGKQYKKANNFSISPAAASSYYYGYKQRVVVFTENADQEFYFFILPYQQTPSIQYAYFQDSEKVRRYGDSMHLQILLHQYPDNINRTGNYEAKVYLLEKKDALKADSEDAFNSNNVWGKPIVKTLAFTDYAIQDSINTLITIDFIIGIDWRKGDKEDKIFTPVIEIYEVDKGVIYDSRNIIAVTNFAKDPSKNLKRYNSKLLGMEDLEKEKDPLYSEFKVSEEAMSEYLERREFEKNNMIQYIGDINYTKKENNHCAYSLIKVTEGDRTITIFNEYELENKVKDSTSNTFDIVAGDKEKVKVTVTAKFKPNKEGAEEDIHLGDKYLCESILNDGHQHLKPDDVFKMKYIVGQWQPTSDYAGRLIDKLINFSSVSSFRFYHPDNAAKAPVLKSNDPYQKKYDNDQQAKGMPNPSVLAEQFKHISVAEVQGLSTKDYTIAKDSITLDLGYVYNKAYENVIADYLGTQEAFEGGILHKTVKNLWVVKYLDMLIRKKKMYQTYFVPVSTCRYPNQVAKINVYPDMKWVFNFNYNIKTPIYYRPTASLVNHYAGYNEGRVNSSNNNTRKKIMEDWISQAAQNDVGRKTSFSLGVECEVSGEDDVISISTEMGEKYRKMLSPLLGFVNRLDSDLGVTDASEENTRLRRTAGTGLMARLSRLPMSFEIEAPSLGVGVGIGYGGATTGKIGYELEGRIVADPLIGANVKLDILALGSKLKPWGLIIDALDLASWATNFLSGGRVELDYKIEVRFTARIKLVGKKTGTNEKTKEPEYEGYANLKYNFEDKKFNFNGGIEGKILGEIEISASVKILAKVSAANARVLDEKKEVAEAGIGAKASSYVTLTCPFEIKDGGVDVDFYFSGVKLEVWFKASLNPNDNNGKPNLVKKLVPKLNLTEKIQF